MTSNLEKISRITMSGDGHAMELLDRFLDAAREHFSVTVLQGDNRMPDVIASLWRLNSYLIEQMGWKDSFFAGDDSDVHRFIGELFQEIYQQRRR